MASLTSYYGATGKIIDTAAYKRAIKKALDDAAKLAKADFQKTTRTWEKQPTFTTHNDGEFAREVSTDNEIYGYVTHGTRPHIIRPVNAQSLAFQIGYSAKTVVNVIGSTAGGSSGATVFAQEVHHPGTKPRKFEQAIAQAVQPKLERFFLSNFQDIQR